MKKVIWFALLFGLFVMSWTPAMAKKEQGALPAPQNVAARLDAENICFSWDAVTGASKYSLDIAVYVDVDGDSFTDKVVEFSLGVGGQTDGFDPSSPGLCVPFSDIVYDVDGDGKPEQVWGTAHVRVKALNPGKGNGRQNNAFSEEFNYTLSSQNSAPAPSTIPDPLPLPDPLPPPTP